jgi:uncharacterized membrane-anchored protein YhcB (DUF1043 family)
MITYRWDYPKSPYKQSQSELQKAQRKLNSLKRKHKEVLQHYGKYSGTDELLSGLKKSIRECEDHIIKLGRDVS